jgi:hypothetical protein
MGDKQLNVLNEFENLNLFDNKGNRVYEFITDSDDGDWCKNTYDSDGNLLTSENSDGVKKGFDIPEFTMEQLVEKLGHDFKIIKQ